MISKSKLSEICGCVFIAIHSLCKGFSFSQADTIYYVISIFSLLVLAFKAINCEYSIKEFLYYSISIFLAILVFMFSGNLTILLSVMAIFACKDLKIKSFLKIIFFTRCFSFLSMILLSSFNIISTNDIIFNRGNEILFRKSFGYLHPNETALQLILIVTSGLLLLEKQRNKNIAIIIFGVLNYLVYMATYSRSTFLIILMFLILEVLVVNISIVSKMIKKFIGVILIVPIIVTIIFMNFYGEIEILYEVNELLTGRVQYAYLICNLIKPRLFGISYEIFDLEKIYIDNGFIKLLYIDGIIFTLLLIPFVISLIKKIKRFGKIDYLVVMILFFFYAITESSFDNSINTYIWLLYPTLMIKRNYREGI